MMGSDYRHCLLPLYIFIYTLMLWKPCPAVYVNRYTASRQIGKLRYMAKELVWDADRKIYSVQFFRDQYHKSITYQLGEMVYHMRDKFKKMVYLYQMTERNVTQVQHFLAENIDTLVLTQKLGREIEALIEMVEEFEIKRETKKEFHQRKKSPMVSGVQPQDWPPLPTKPKKKKKLWAGLRVGTPLNSTVTKKKNKKWKFASIEGFK